MLTELCHASASNLAGMFVQAIVELVDPPDPVPVVVGPPVGPVETGAAGVPPLPPVVPVPVPVVAGATAVPVPVADGAGVVVLAGKA